MYAKVFSQIFDSSIADDYELRHFFMDLLVLCESDGVVDMTQEAIAARTRMPVNSVREMLLKLESPDPRSRTHTKDGSRIIRIDPQRDWGWKIVNYENYRDIRDEDERKNYMRDYMRDYRSKRKLTVNSVNSGKPKQKHTTEADAEGSTRGGSASLMLLVLEEWNKLQGLPQCLLLSDKRRRVLEVRFREKFFLDGWRLAMEKLSKSAFCKGDSDRGWKATFDWFISPDAVVKIMEGKYDGNSNSRAGKPNPRNFGIVRGPTDYATAKPRLQREREAAEAARLAGQVATPPNNPPAANSG